MPSTAQIPVIRDFLWELRQWRMHFGVNCLNHNPAHAKWFNRDRFVLSAGHGSALLYSLLHLSGYNVSIEDLKQFRKLNSKTPGHPEFGHTDGVDATTGPLGQGIAMAVGMAMAEAHLASKFNQERFPGSRSLYVCACRRRLLDGRNLLRGHVDGGTYEAGQISCIV